MIPKLNETPKYDLTVPSTGQEIRFRPYLVKEEKVLLTAFQSESRKHGLKAVADTVQACVGEQINVSDLTLYDVEYLFTKIRSKSAGEMAKVKMYCNSCEVENEVNVNLDILSCEQKSAEGSIQLTDDITVDVVIPTFIELLDDDELLDAKERHEKILKTIGHAIKTVRTSDEVIDVKEEGSEEVQNFIESMNQEQFQKIYKFVQDRPRLVYNIDFKCVKCGHDNHKEIKETKHFF